MAGRKRLGCAALAGLLLLLGGCAAKADPQPLHPETAGLDGHRQVSGTDASALSAGDEIAALPEPKPEPPQPAVTETFTGLASWYGRRFHGRLTASGEPYDMKAMTAAHQTLPFGSRVRVTNLANGRSVVVVINDRGPYVKRRLIDLSHAAAKKLDILEDGVAKVRLDVLAGGEDQAAGGAPSLN